MLEAVSLIDRLSPHAKDVGRQIAIGETSDLLPQLHRELLASLNGFTVQNGTRRLFGVGRGDSLDLDWWNDIETWRFAWDDRVDPYLFFGATAWGDQFAYRRSEAGELEPTVYFLEGVLLRARVWAESFSDFAESELLRVAADPYDPLATEAVNRYGPLKVENLWTFAPSIALGGDDSVDNVMSLPAQTAMVFAGDIASGLESSLPDAWPTGVEPWKDARGIQRLRVLFDR